ncbi:site-specific integrase [Maribacter algarum]|uniref:Site-specific integrase n=1 Tax=Maribacter algarum (ex Zhang et al. 2020) TaxID=2578118 RepID=A0A5S3PG93_9FLAO|nr:site-specific integrase [Maribacter algarum]TMM53125.1 site-specific integrase [Maribacter algarum]
MNDSFSILFYIRKNMPDRNGLCPIYLRITVSGKRSEISAKRKVKVDDWNCASGRAKNSKPSNRELNKYLEDLRARLYRIQGKYEADGRSYTSQMIKNSFQGKSSRHKTLLNIYEGHNKEISEIVGREFSSGAYQRHLRTLRHLKAFIDKEYGQEDVYVKEVDLKFINRFEHYLKTNLKACGQNTVTKYVTNLKKIMRICYANDWISKDPFYHWKAKWKKVERDILNERELKILMETELPLQRLEQVRDIFIFCCFTGLSYIDVEKLSDNHIVLNIKGEKWIKINRSKTDTKSSVPLLPIAEKILQKYSATLDNNQNKLLPVISNQKLNTYLKEIAAICNIEKKLTFHLSRHTFATTVTLANGVPIESVSKMLGHSSLKTTQIYAMVIDKKLMNDMKRIVGKY